MAKEKLLPYQLLQLKMTPEDRAIDIAKRARLKQACLNAKRRELGLEPLDAGLHRGSEELDPYLRAQLTLLDNLIDQSRDPITGVPTKVGPMEFLFREMHDPNNDKGERIRSAIKLMEFLHKKVPQALAVPFAGNSGTSGGDEAALATEQGSTVAAITGLLSRLTGQKHQPESPSVKAVLAKHKKAATGAR